MTRPKCSASCCYNEASAPARYVTAETVRVLRRDAATLGVAGIAAVNGRQRVAAALPAKLPGHFPVRAAAVGKAATAMLRGAVDALGGRLEAGIAVCAPGYITERFRATDNIELIESSHPFPSEASVAAGERLIGFLAHTRAPGVPLLLLSGGASSMIELPRADLQLADIERANRWLLGSGLDIGAINRVRASLSRLKGGGLASEFDRGVVLAISDVAGDDPALIGSGPLHAPTGALPASLPGWLRTLARRETKRRQRPVRYHVIATPNDALVAIAQVARRMGYALRHARRDLCQDALQLADRLALERAPGCCVHAGEPTVRLPPEPGEGGRCQQLALALAQRVMGREGWVAHTVATDGRDGASLAAGAIVDGATVARGQARGLDAAAALQQAAATPFLAASGDLYFNAPTGTNIADFVILLQHES